MTNRTIWTLFDSIFGKMYGDAWELQHKFSIKEEIKGTGLMVFTVITIESNDVFSDILTPEIYKNLKFDGWFGTEKEDDIFHKVIEI